MPIMLKPCLNQTVTRSRRIHQSETETFSTSLPEPSMHFTHFSSHRANLHHDYLERVDKHDAADACLYWTRALVYQNSKRPKKTSLTSFPLPPQRPQQWFSRSAWTQPCSSFNRFCRGLAEVLHILRREGKLLDLGPCAFASFHQRPGFNCFLVPSLSTLDGLA